MAKTAGSLFSLGAKGKLAKKVSYTHRKGASGARKYVVPANPRTGVQQVQRGYLRDAVLAWRTDGFTALDLEAWKVYASIQKKHLSAYNMFLRERINAAKNSSAWTKLTNCVIYGVDGQGFKVDISVESDLSGVLYLGTSKLSLLKEYEGVFDTDKYTFTVTGLLGKTRYYFYVKNTASGEVARTGIYTVKTVGAVVYGWFVAGWFSTGDWFYCGG